LEWLRKHAVSVSPLPLGKQRSRDVDDDIFIACALGAGAKTIISDDEDLLSLRKAVGVSIIHTAQFIATHRL